MKGQSSGTETAVQAPAVEERGTPFILFELAGATYALPSDDIQQLDMVGAITPVPNAPSFVDGVVAVRGQVVPVVNLRTRFGFARAPLGVRSRILVVRSGGRTVGVLVDAAREFALIPGSAIRPPPEGISTINGRYLQGMAQLGERLVLVLQVADLFDPDADPFIPIPSNAPEGSAGELNA
jgi:purine-binding chemotaxis protein CheW